MESSIATAAAKLTNLLSILISLILFVSVSSLVTKLVVYAIDLKFKIKINFKFFKLHQLASISIIKQTQSGGETKFEIYIDKLWLSSCYLNRQINNRIVLCLNNVNINYLSESVTPASSKSNSLINFILRIYFKYIGSLSIETLTLKSFSQTKVNITLHKVKIETNKQLAILSNVSSNLKVANKQFELNLDLSIRETCLKFNLHELNSIELSMQNAVCLVNSNNKLINLDQRYYQNNYLIDYFNSIELKRDSKSSDYLNRIHNVEISNFQCKIISNQSADKNKKIKLDEIKLTNSSEKFILVKNLTYSTARNRNKFNLLTKLLVGYKTSSQDLTLECENLNSFLHFKFIHDVIDSNVLKLLVSKSKQKTSSSRVKSFILKVSNSYIHLNDDTKLTYSFGANKFNLIKNNELKIDIRQPIVFKSTVFGTQPQKFLNNLFEMINVNSNCLNNSINHYWGSLVRLNKFHFKKTNNACSFTLGSLALEYSISSLKLIDYLSEFYEQFAKLYLTKSTQEFSVTQIKLLIKSIDFYLLHKEKYLINFNLTNLNFKHLNSDFILSTDGFTGVKYILQDVNKTHSQDLNHHQQQVSYCFIEEKSKISSLIFLIEDIHLNKCAHKHYLCMKSVQLTWSLQIHYILYDTLIKPFKTFSTRTSTNKQLEFKLLVESDVLLNLELNYANDSSKKMTTNSFYLPITTSQVNQPTMQTVSIVLTDTYLSLSSQSEIRFNFREASMFISTTHASEFFTESELATSESILKQKLQNDCNKRQFVSLKSFEISLLTSSNLLVYERALVNTADKRNKLTLVSMDYFNLNFIFNFDFAKLIDHLLNIRKCLLKIHNIKSVKQDRLSSDLMLQMKKFQLTIEDDPFEIKLAYNYALMRDEHVESAKRHETLEQSRLIKEQNLAKEALKMLNQRESIIYMQRSNKIYGRNEKYKSQTRAVRTELFCFTGENFDFYALADSNWCTRQQCYELLRKIDKHSPLSSTMIQSDDPASLYQILWCRFVSLNVDEIKFIFRDYTQPLLKLNKVNLFGNLVGAEQEPAARARRDVKIAVFDTLEDDTLFLDENLFIEIERSMSPIKFYHDLACKMSLFQVAYGPCWEGTMAQLNLALDKIIHPARDPSKPMPWWDKSRLYLHGAFVAHVTQLQIIYHVSMDPYNRTEEMKWVWSQLYFDWTNMQIIFKGDLDIFLNTESKYDDCRFLHLPNLELKIKIDWICKNNNKNLANLHNNVMPCAPDKLPVIINSSEHDSYAQFRSENVNISISFVCNLSQLDDLPTCKFYASTSRFIQRIKTLLSTITRPIRRGRVFQNLKLKKPILSRHFKITKINFDIPKLNIIYWSSASEEYGTLVECEHFKLNSAHKLELIPFLDTLKRRPKPNWTIEIMKCRLAQTTIYLMGPINRSPTAPAQSNQQQSIKFLESERVTRSFFMQIDSIFYEREKNLSTSSVFFEEKKQIITDDDDLLFVTTNASDSTTTTRRKSKFLSYSFKSPKRQDLDVVAKASCKSGSFKIPSNTKKSSPSPPPPPTAMNKTLNYSREEATLKNVSISSLMPFKVKNIPKHNIQIRNLKAKWNNINRDVIYILYEIYNKSKRLRHNISSQALKEYDLLTDQIVQSFVLNNSNLNSSQINLSRKSSVSGSKNPINQTIGSFDNETINTNTFFEELLNKLDAEREINSEIYCDEKKLVEYNDLLYGVHAANKMNDIINENIFIEIINSQVKLSLESDVLSDKNKPPTATTPSNPKQQKNKSIDSPFECLDDNYLIISAARANVVQRLHKPVWKSQRLLDKTSWNGYLEGMQYFATLDTGSDEKQFSQKQFQQFKDEYWLPDDLIDPNEANNPSEPVKQTKLSDEISNSSSSGSNAPLVITADPSAVTKTNLGMLVACNSISEPHQSSQSNINSVNNKQTKADESTKEKRRFGFGKSNRKLAKPDLNSDAQNQSNNNARYLQLIVSKCRCEFYMIDFDDRIPNTDEYNSHNPLNYSHLYQKLERQASTDENLFRSSYSHTSSVSSSHNTLNNQIDLNATFNEPIDCFSLIHYDLNLCTNSKQYKMIMNLVNNLVLYFRPRRKQVIDKQKAIKFNLQLSMGNLDSLKSHIQLKQIEAKELLCRIRAMERKLYHLRERIQNEIRFYQEQLPMDQVLIASQLISIQELNNENFIMEKEYKDTKNRLNELSDELNISISCYKEIILEKRAYTLANTTHYRLTNNPTTQSVFNKYKLNKNAKKMNESHIKLEQAQQSILNNEVGKRYEIWFKRTQWNLNDLDGQTGCAQFLMKNFLYTKVTNQQELDCVEHTLEIESCKLKDLSELNVNTNSGNSSSKRKDSKTNNLDCFVLTALYDESLDASANDDSQVDFNDDTYDSSDINLVKNSNNDLLSNNSSMIRVYCKERPPIGIPVFEQVELNVSPLSINLTNNFFKMMMNFFFNNSTTQSQSTPSITNSSNEFKSQQSAPPLLSRNSNFRHSYHNQFSVQSNDEQMHLNLITNSNNGNNFVLTPSISPLSIESLNNNNNTNNPTFVPISPSGSSILTPNYASNSASYAVNLQSIQSPPPQIKQVKNLMNKKPSQTSLFNVDTPTQLNTNLTPATSTSSQLQHDDIEIMKQRAANNNTFLCIKIPEIQLLVSYRATNKDKNNVKDLTKVSLIFPLFEEHDKTWTYVDLINALKSHVKKAVLSQVVKHKIKVPIQPVNKLISRTKRSNSQQHLSNLDLDECEQITFLKFFGTKFIEKKSLNQSFIQNTVNLVPNQIDSDLLQQHKLLSSSIQTTPTREDTPSELNESFKKSTPKVKKPLFKSNSLLYFKKNFLKFNNKESNNSNGNTSLPNSNLNTTNDVIDTSESPSLDEIK